MPLATTHSVPSSRVIWPVGRSVVPRRALSCQPAVAAAAGHAATTQQQQQQQRRQVEWQACWSADAWAAQSPALLQRLDAPCPCSPQELWQHVASFGPTHEEQQQRLRQHLDLDSCRLLLLAAASTCSTSSQAELNRLQPLILAATAVLPQFELHDFRLLLRVCAAARFVPDKEWLAALIYADTGGFERLYGQTPPAQLVPLFSDLAAMLSSQGHLLSDTQQLLQQQEQADSGAGPAAVTATAAAGALSSELSALQSCLQTSARHLHGIQQDQLLAGELSAMGGYWLLRKLLPQLATEAAAAATAAGSDKQASSPSAAAVGAASSVVLAGLLSLPGLGYQVLDSSDTDVLLQLLASQLHAWDCSQLAAALAACLPCLGQQAPSDGSLLAVLFAAAGAAAGGMSSSEAGRLLVVLEQLPVYAPDATVAQALLNRALQPPLQLSARQLYQLLAAAQELGAAPLPQQLVLVQEMLGSGSSSDGDGRSQ